MNVEQFKKDMGLEICEHNDPPCSFCMMKVNQILSHPFLAHYLKLLEQTRDNCPECLGQGVIMSLLPDMKKRRICEVCQGTGKTEPHPKRLIISKLNKICI